MDKGEMLEDMCETGLSQADVKAICNARNLPLGCLSSRELLRHHFLAETGIQEVIASLDEKQTLFLHLLNATGKERGIQFFTRLYEQAHPNAYWHTFNDKYKTVFKRVKTELIRKGLILCAESPKSAWEKTTILERQRFMFPDSFAPFLPAPVDPVRIEASGYEILRQDTLRDKLAEILEPQKAPDSKSGSTQGRLHLKNGNLRLGKQPFTVARLKSWNRSRWASSVTIESDSGDAALSAVDLVEYALSFLAEDCWAAPDDILPLWEIAYPAGNRLPDPHSVYEKGWNRGCLEKIVKDGRALYRLAQVDTAREDRKPEDFLLLTDDECIGIDLSRVPLDALQWLCGVCNMSILEGRLTAQPDLVKISHATEDVQKEPAFAWLREHHEAFGRIVRTIAKRRGKTVVHNNLMTARVRDLGLKVQLEKKFSNSKQVVSLSDEFISFPVGLFPEIRKAVTKSGYAVKLVDDDGND